MFTDDHLSYTEVYITNAASEAAEKFKQYVAKVGKQHPKSKVCRIRVDGGGEYASRGTFLNDLAEEGIIREVSAPYSQEQNGISERCNHTALDPARSMLKHAAMPNTLWARAVSTAVNIKNRLPSQALPNSTRFNRWIPKMPDISHLGTFGFLAFMWISGDLSKNSITGHTTVSSSATPQRHRHSTKLWTALWAEYSLLESFNLMCLPYITSY